MTQTHRHSYGLCLTSLKCQQQICKDDKKKKKKTHRARETCCFLWGQQIWQSLCLTTRTSFHSSLTSSYDTLWAMTEMCVRTNLIHSNKEENTHCPKNSVQNNVLEEQCWPIRIYSLAGSIDFHSNLLVFFMQTDVCIFDHRVETVAACGLVVIGSDFWPCS